LVKKGKFLLNNTFLGNIDSPKVLTKDKGSIGIYGKYASTFDAFYLYSNNSDTDDDGYPNSNDCNDNDPSINPGAIDIPCDSIDQDCSGADAVGAACIDKDKDGYMADVDCNDNNNTVYPGAQELCDGLDNDCDPGTPDGFGSGFLSIADAGPDQYICQEKPEIKYETHTLIFDYTGVPQYLTIPAESTGVQFTVKGAGGGGGRQDQAQNAEPGQPGHLVTGIYPSPTTSNVTLTIYVGGGGKVGSTTESGAAGGWGYHTGSNGGDGEYFDSEVWAYGGAGGGGSSAVLEEQTRLVEAQGGAGGSSSDWDEARGGSGGPGGGSDYPSTTSATGGGAAGSIYQDGGNGQVVVTYLTEIPQTNTNNVLVSLDGSGSSNPTGGTLSYLWSDYSQTAPDFDTATGVSPDVNLSVGTTHEVMLQVTNDMGCVNTDLVKIFIAPYTLQICDGLDSDGDGLLDIIEYYSCTDRFDLDSDDDGIPDGTEDANLNGAVEEGETNPCAIDTDNDGIQDGTELGILVPVADPDGGGPLLGTDSTVFIPDSDPTTTTDPLRPDTDKDGMPDGAEDRNHNGAVDLGELSPNCAPGDVNYDQKVDLADALLSLQVISDSNTDQTVYKAGDINGDGIVGTAEVIYVLQSIGGLTPKPGQP
jgi:hypothetical protein